MKYFYHEDEVDSWRDYTGIPEIFAEDKGRFKVLSDPDSPDLFFGIYELDPGEKHVLHHHKDAAEWYYFIEGTALVRVDDQEQQCGPGTAIYMPVNAKHSIYNNGDKTIRLFWGYNKHRTYDSFVWDDEKVAKIWERVKPKGDKLAGQE